MDDTPRRVRINRDVELSTGDGPADPWLVPAPAAAPPPPAPAPAPADLLDLISAEHPSHRTPPQRRQRRPTADY